MSFKTNSRRGATAPPIWLAGILTLLASFSASGCRPPRVIVIPPTPCMTRQHPPFPDTVLTGIVDDACPSDFVCLTQSAAIDLGEWIDAISVRGREEWAACGPARDAASAASSSAVSPPASASATATGATAPTH